MSYNANARVYYVKARLKGELKPENNIA